MTASQTTLLVLLAGVPGAGKTEALREIRQKAPWARSADSETVRSLLYRCAPWLPYPLCRPLVHTIAHIAAIVQILRRGGGQLIVHDPGTRQWSRRLLLRLSLLRGYETIAVYIDIERDTALRGQVQRQRIVRSQAFERHWQHWLDLRQRILADVELTPGEQWAQVVLSSRYTIVDDVLEVLNVHQAGTHAPPVSQMNAQRTNLLETTAPR